MAAARMELTAGGLKQLCDDRIPESSFLDFKRELPGRSDKERHEFLKDVTAFANSEGGDLIFGITEQAGHASELTGITDEPADSVIRRLGQILDAGVEPRLHGVQFISVPLEGSYALVLRIPASLDGPHRYLFNGHSKFVMRNGTHTSEFTYSQLRAGFDRTATLAERARTVWHNRWNAVARGNTWKPFVSGPICIVQLVPMLSMAGRQLVDMNVAYEKYSRFMFKDWGGASCTFNLDGLVVYSGDISQNIGAFTQVHRTGVLEAYRTGASVFSEKKIIPSTTVAEFIRDAVEKFVNASRDFDIYGPAVMNVALLNVDDYEFAVRERFYSRDPAFADRQHLILPEVWIEELRGVDSVDDVARPILDILWQAFGRSRCIEYDDQGVWKPR